MAPYAILTAVHRTTILLPDELDQRLSEAARRHGRSRTDLLRQALSAFLDDEVRPRPRSIGAGQNPSPAVTSENVKQSVRAAWLETQAGR